MPLNSNWDAEKLIDEVPLGMDIVSVVMGVEDALLMSRVYLVGVLRVVLSMVSVRLEERATESKEIIVRSIFILLLSFYYNMNQSY